MRYIKLGSTGLDVSPIAIGAMTYGEPESRPPGLVAGRGGEPAAHQARAGRRHQLLRHREHVLARVERGDSRPCAQGLRQPRRNRDRYQGAPSDASWPERRRPVAQGDPRPRSTIACGASARTTSTSTRSIGWTRATPIEETLEALHDVVKAGKARYLGASSMHAWEFSKVLHLQRQHGWARFVSMQDHYNLLAREEEREMLPLCADEGVGTIVWSPLARGRLTRGPGRDDEAVRDRSLRRACSTRTKRAIAPSSRPWPLSLRPGASAARKSHWRGFAGIPSSSRRSSGASKASHIDDAVASLAIDLTDEEVARPGAALHASLRLPGHFRRRRARPHLCPDRDKAA